MSAMLIGFIHEKSECDCCGKKNIQTVVFDRDGQRFRMGLFCCENKATMNGQPQPRKEWKRLGMIMTCSREFAAKQPGQGWETGKPVTLAI